MLKSLKRTTSWRPSSASTSVYQCSMPFLFGRKLYSPRTFSDQHEKLHVEGIPMSPEGTNAHKIETQLDEHIGTTWGFVIYRATYGDDQAWARFLSLLKEQTQR